MSETTRNSTNATESTGTKEEVKVVIDLEDAIDFDPVSDSKFINSKGFCELVSQLFRGVYADFEGCKFEFVPATNSPMICLFFNHRDYDKDEIVACSKDIDEDNTKNVVLRSVRRHDRFLQQGDRYLLTEAGKTGIGDFLIADLRSLYKNNGQPNWRSIVAEVADNNVYMHMGQQYTKVSFLDPGKLASVLFGAKDEKGNKWEYGVRVVKSMPTVSNMFSTNTAASEWMLAIDRVCEANVLNLAREFGLSVTSGLSIVR